MSATNFTPIQLYRTTTAAAAPVAGNLAAGELAINLTDEKLYFKNAAGVVKLLASNSGALGTVTSVDVSGGTTGLTTSGGPITSSGTITLAGTLGVANGGTGATTFTANGVVYGNTTSALLVTAAGTTGQVLVGNTGAAPSWATLTGIGVTSFSAGTTGFTPSTATTGAITLAGTLGVANGGTGTTTAFTAGSVVFAGASGVYSQDNANFFWDDTNNRLGIGTASPGYKLDVVGGNGDGLQYRTSTRAIGIGQISSEPSVFWGSGTPLTFFSGSELMRITSAGNVGIGTTSPVMKFDVRGGAFFGVSASTLPAGTGSGLYINYEAPNTRAYIGDASGYSFRFSSRVSSATTDIMTIQDTGNVGIGTASPSFRLQVETDNDATAGIYTRNSNTGTSASGALSVNSLVGGIGIRAHSAANSAWPSSTLITSDSGFTGGLNLFQNGANPIKLWTDGTERMRITSAGNVGIGTSSPTEKLDVTGNIYASGSIQAYGTGSIGTNLQLRSVGASPNIQFNRPSYQNWFMGSPDVSPDLYIAEGAASTYRMYFASGGNVGIGTSSPSARLTIAGNLDFDQNRTITFNGVGTSLITNPADAGIVTINTGTTAGFVTSINLNGGGASPANAIRFNTASAERMRIDSSGNVGIGTANPAQKLAVSNGGANGFELDPSTGILQTYNRSTSAYSGLLIYAADQRFFTGTSPAERARITSAGQMLVGTTTANGIFSVVGDQISVGNAAGSGALGIQIKGTALSAIPAAQVQAYIATGDSAMGVAGDLLIAPRTDVVANIRFITGTTPAERMRIDSTGNVGIGTSSPPSKLTVTGTNASGAVASQTQNLDAGGSSVAQNVVYHGAGASLTLQAGSGYTALIGSTAVPLLFSTDSTERMRINSAGDVGIGTSSPLSKLTVQQGADGFDQGFSLSRTGADRGTIFLNATGNTMNFGRASATSMTITSIGDVGIGTTSVTGSRVQIKGANNSVAAYDDGLKVTSNNETVLCQYSWAGISNNTQIQFAISGTEKMRLDGSGNFLVGTTSTSVYNSASATGHVLEANGTVQHSRSGFAALLLNRTTSDGSIVEFFRDGSVVGTIGVTTTATAYNTSSDYRLKDIDGPITNSGAYIDALKPVQGSWKADGSRFIGLLAHEVQEVSETPIATGEKDGEEMQAMDYSAPELIANLIAEIQSLRARVAQLEGN